MTIPGFIKQPAGWLDTGEKGIHPMGTPVQRKPQGDALERAWQTLEMNLPGLRQNVPVKDERDYQSKDSKTPIQKKKAEMKKKKKEIRRSMGLKD